MKPFFEKGAFAKASLLKDAQNKRIESFNHYGFITA